MNPLRTFAHVDTWVFDLDNTLYPHHVNLWQQVDVRITEFVSSWLQVTPLEARKIQKDYYLRFGTTMRGMMTLLVVPDGTKEVVREDWELEGRDAAHVDHVTDDLAGFLAALSR